jgi:outer membrane protein OmpA-like peptidoglycan-associated protein
MKTTRILAAALALAAISTLDADAQSFLDRLGRRVQQRAEEAITRKAEQATEKAIDKVTDPGTYTGDGNNQQQQQEPPPATGAMPGGATPGGAMPGATPEAAAQAPQQSLEMTYAKNDFVPGDEIIFSDDLAGEQMGEFPSQWDLLQGNAEVANFNGAVCINLESPSTNLAPLMKDMKSYLPDVFTVELDYWVNSYTETNAPPSQNYRLHFYDATGRDVMELEFAEGRVTWSYDTPDGERRHGDLAIKEKIDSWSHLSVSFNKRAFKAYVNGVRVTNIPNMAVPVRLSINRTSWNDHRTAIKDFRIAKGAVPLYDRMMTDGKFITYGITFDVGKSTIKPESMGEINRIVQMMTENPDLKFSVEGHTDSTGNAASNQTLSEARSAAIVAKLTELGIAADRLTSSGKGQNTPIADNSTDEGRAKNRRVEFVKL